MLPKLPPIKKHLSHAIWCLALLHTPSFAHTHSPSNAYANTSLMSVPTTPNFNEQWQNRLIANWSLQQLNASTPIIQDPYAVERLYHLTATINAQARSQALLAVPIINSSQINAFAIPGGLIGINTGTILSAQSQDEYASVLAHEVAHLSQRHYEHNKDNKNKQLAIQLGGLLTAIAASAVGGDGATAAMIASHAISAESAAAHSRDHEREADRIGMQIMARAGFDVQAMPRFFERLHRQTTLNTSTNAFIPSFIKSHPLTSERLSEAYEFANRYPAKSHSTNAQAFDLLKWRLHYLGKTATVTELTQAAKNSTGAKLALIALLADLRRFDEATALFDRLDTNQTDPLFCITHAHIAYEQGDFAKAVQILTPCQTLYPERTDLRLYLADSLVFAKRDLDAERLLLPIVKAQEHHTLAWNLLQKNYENRANASTGVAKALANIHALRARGKQELWTGSYDKALNSFAAAKDHAQQERQAGLVSVLEKDQEQVRLYRDFKIK